ncbi:hypothetical protein J2741_000399 [Methanolinea mesophila]|uniref:hypothetical protein n=1 Tax=Methanolinea mesophila TaxID=547055 RepID=UPI001AE58C36|nr:hypothetical protein [Methanolinea mesophila]MBP1927852.1 hypothetical protein [Methanolinea mesophila]
MKEIETDLTRVTRGPYEIPGPRISREGTHPLREIMAGTPGAADDYNIQHFEHHGR